MLRTISGPKRDKATEGWKKLNNEKLHSCTLQKYYYDQIKEGTICGRYSMHRRDEKGKKNSKKLRPLGIPRLRWEDSIKIDIKVTKYESMY
jgi:hypothetical protein